MHQHLADVVGQMHPVQAASPAATANSTALQSRSSNRLRAIPIERSPSRTSGVMIAWSRIQPTGRAVAGVKERPHVAGCHAAGTPAPRQPPTAGTAAPN